MNKTVVLIIFDRFIDNKPFIIHMILCDPCQYNAACYFYEVQDKNANTSEYATLYIQGQWGTRLIL